MRHVQVYERFGRRESAATAYLAKARRRRNLTIHTEALVSRSVQCVVFVVVESCVLALAALYRRESLHAHVIPVVPIVVLLQDHLRGHSGSRRGVHRKGRKEGLFSSLAPA